MRILFVDDTPDTCQLFRLAFWLEGHLTQVAGNGQEAVTAVQAVKPGEEFDAIVMDVEMPEMNGWEAARAIRQLDGDHKMPLILFSAYGTQEEHRQKAAEAGADALLGKPVLPEEVLAEIKRLSEN